MSTELEYKSDTEKKMTENGQDIWTPVPYSVVKKETENQDLYTFTLAPMTDQKIHDMQAGQFNMLYTFGIGEIPISVSRIEEESDQLIHTIQDVGPVSKAICNLNVGEQIGVRGPFGTIWSEDAAEGKDVLIIMGGVGFAPLKPLIESFSRNRDRINHFNILYGTRSPENIIFHKDVIALQSNPDINFQITVDHAYSSWQGNVGVVTTLMNKADFDPENTIAYVCGPEIMMRYAATSCLSAQIPEENIYLSMERNMKCATGFCGHCQFGPYFVCKDGAVFKYPQIKPFLNIPEL